MNSGSGKNYSLEELKQMNAGDIATARQGERHIQVTEKNWEAVLRVLERLSTQQLQLQAAFELLLTKKEALTLLHNLHTDAELFAKQAGSMSERFASSAESLTSSAQTSIGKMEESAKWSLEKTLREMNGKIYDLTQESRRRLVTQGVVSVTLTVLAIILVTFFALWKVR